MAKGGISNIPAIPKPGLGKKGGITGPNRNNKKSANKGSSAQPQRLLDSGIKKESEAEPTYGPTPYQKKRRATNGNYNNRR